MNKKIKEFNYHYEKEYIEGIQTGDYVCIYCGDTCWGKPENKVKKVE